MTLAQRPDLEVADVFRGERVSAWTSGLSSAQRRVARAVESCRTAALGGHVSACDRCDHRTISYNSCRNRHCPKCQAMARAHWLQQRSAELLPIPYFHLVFTLPREIADLALQNKRLLYGLLFQAASQTLREVAANPRHLGAHEIGVLAVLHTWGQNLMHHPHLHCVVSGGGLSTDGQRWIAAKPHYFLPVRVLSRVFRNRYRRLLEQAYQRGEVQFHGRLSSLAEPARWRRWLAGATRSEWVVYAKRPFGGPELVLKYLARYTHRVAIANSRLVKYQDGQVTFRYKDYAHGGQSRMMTLAAREFVRRFLLHVLPEGFMRIRHYGYLANRRRHEKLARCRELLSVTATAAAPEAPPILAAQVEAAAPPPAPPVAPCPVCAEGRLHVIERWEPAWMGVARPCATPRAHSPRGDTS
jgi:hypothetical protein